jgi:hypothetical protein
MANNYKVKTFSNSTTGTSQALFTASAATTLVKSVIVNCDKTTPNVNAILRIKKSGGTEELIKKVNIIVQVSSYEMLYDVLPLEAGDALYAQSDDTDITWIMSWVESTTSVIGQSIDGLSDVDTTGKADGDVLVYNSTSGNWEAEAGGGGGNSFETIAVAGQTSVVADSATDTLTLAAGTGITITTNATTDTVTITNSATGANAFGNVAVAGQTTVAADSTNDTLTLAAGTGITITTNDTTDTVTITNSVTAPNTFGTIAVATQSSVVADSTTDTLTLVGAGGTTITTNATTDTVTFTSARLDDDDVALSGIREIDLNGENLNIVNGTFDMLLLESDGIRQTSTVFAEYSGTSGAQITLTEASANGASSISIKAPDSLTVNTTYTLPSADGTSGQVLATDSTGGLSWATRSSLSFSTIAVAGQSNVVADSAADTLTLAAGSGITITTDAGADSITIAASGGGGTPAGATGNIQYNASGAFGAEDALFYDATNNRLSVGGNTSPTGTITSRGAGTTTGVAFRIEDSGATTRLEILDSGRSSLTTTVISNTPSLSITTGAPSGLSGGISLRRSDTSTSLSAANGQDTSTFFIVRTEAAAGGGHPTIMGFSNSTALANSLKLTAIHGSTAPTASPFRLQGNKSNGSTGYQALANTEQVISYANFSTELMMQLGNGAMGIRNSAPTNTTTLTVRGQGTSTNECLRAEDNSGTARFVIRDNGGFAFSGGTVGVAQTGYTTFTNLTTDRTCDANATTVEELADILGTLIEDLKTKGIIAA